MTKSGSRIARWGIRHPWWAIDLWFAFVATTGYTQSTCVIPGTMVKVAVTYTYPLLTPLLSRLYPGGVTVTANASFLEET